MERQPLGLDSRSRLAFLVMVLMQAAHSVEEYVFKLYDVFEPARLVSGLLSDDLRTGFVVFNASLFAFGVWCYVARVRVGHPSAQAWMWPWVLVEFGNGLGHPAVALARRGYFPGVVTAPALLALSSIWPFGCSAFRPKVTAHVQQRPEGARAATKRQEEM